MYLQIASLTLISVTALQLPASIHLSIGNVDGMPGTTSLVGVFAYSDANDVLSGFNLPMELGNDGAGLPDGVNFNATPLQNTLFPNFSLNQQQNAFWDIDGIVNSDGNDFTLSTLPSSPTKLFDLAIDIAPTAVDSKLPIRVVEMLLLNTAPGPLRLPVDALGELNVITDSILPGDCNGDGLVNATDLSCACSTGITDHLNTTGLLAGDLDADGSVAFADFLVLSGNFGTAGDYPDGDIDCSGQVDFADFLQVSANFGRTSTLAAIPEPHTHHRVVLLLLVVGYLHRRAGVIHQPTN